MIISWQEENRKTESAVQVGKDIENLSTLAKYGQYINLANFYHVHWWEISKCNNFYFICNLWYLYIQNLVNEDGSVEPLQKLCRLNYGSFYSSRTLLRSLAPKEQERIQLDKKFQEILRIWNVLTAKK